MHQRHPLRVRGRQVQRDRLRARCLGAVVDLHRPRRTNIVRAVGVQGRLDRLHVPRRILRIKPQRSTGLPGSRLYVERSRVGSERRRRGRRIVDHIITRRSRIRIRSRQRDVQRPGLVAACRPVGHRHRRLHVQHDVVLGHSGPVPRRILEARINRLHTLVRRQRPGQRCRIRLLHNGLPVRRIRVRNLHGGDDPEVVRSDDVEIDFEGFCCVSFGKGNRTSRRGRIVDNRPVAHGKVRHGCERERRQFCCLVRKGQTQRFEVQIRAGDGADQNRDFFAAGGISRIRVGQRGLPQAEAVIADGRVGLHLEADREKGLRAGVGGAALVRIFPRQFAINPCRIDRRAAQHDLAGGGGILPVRLGGRRTLNEVEDRRGYAGRHPVRVRAHEFQDGRRVGEREGAPGHPRHIIDVDVQIKVLSLQEHGLGGRTVRCLQGERRPPCRAAQAEQDEAGKRTQQTNFHNNAFHNCLPCDCAKRPVWIQRKSAGSGPVSGRAMLGRRFQGLI